MRLDVGINGRGHHVDGRAEEEGGLCWREECCVVSLVPLFFVLVCKYV